MQSARAAISRGVFHVAATTGAQYRGSRAADLLCGGLVTLSTVSPDSRGMCRTRGTVRVGSPLLFACVLLCACRAGSLESGVDGGGARLIAAANDPQGGAPAGGGAPGVVGGSGTAAGSSGTPRTVCPPGEEIASTGGAVLTPPPVVPTRTPFSCAPLPEAFIFPPPAASVPGLYSAVRQLLGRAGDRGRDEPGRAHRGAGDRRRHRACGRGCVAAGGGRAAVSARDDSDDVAFAPDGRAILTLARAQREVTLWRLADWTPAAPVWTTILPGHRYDQMFGGGLAFAPDARSVVVSPGTDVFVLDAATGAVRASPNNTRGAAVLDVAYGLDGSRIVVALPSLAAHCNHVPNGGTVALFDANLQLVATLADFW